MTNTYGQDRHPGARIRDRRISLALFVAFLACGAQVEAPRIDDDNAASGLASKAHGQAAPASIPSG